MKPVPHTNRCGCPMQRSASGEEDKTRDQLTTKSEVVSGGAASRQGSISATLDWHASLGKVHGPRWMAGGQPGVEALRYAVGIKILG